MKEIWKKSGLIYRLVAIMLTIVMVSTSLYFHFDRKYSAKAYTDEECPGLIEIKTMVLKDSQDGNELDDWEEVTDAINLTTDGSKTYAYFVSVPENDWNNIAYTLGETNGDLNLSAPTFINAGKKIYKFDVTDLSKNITINSVTDASNTYNFTDKTAGFTTYTPADLSVEVTINENPYTGEIICGANSTLTVTATSGWKIINLKVLDKDFDASNLDAIANQTRDAGTHLYTVSFTYNFAVQNNNTNKNYTGEDLKIKATDENTDMNKKEIEIASCTGLLYDCTDPVITDTNPIYDGSWKQTFIYNYTLTPGEATDESNLDGNLTISFANTKETIPDETIYIDNSTINSGSFVVPESLDANGTTVTFTASDKAGNAIPVANNGTRVFKIDATKPRLEDISVTITGDKAATDTNVISYNDNGDIDVSINAKDNIIVRSIKAELYNSDALKVGEGTYTFTDDSNDVNHVFKLKDDIYPALTSGDYVLKVTVTDAADNTNETLFEKNIHVDIEKPTITFTEIERRDVETHEWVKIPDDSIYTQNGNNIYFVNKSLYPDGVRYVVVITDAQGNLDTSLIKVVDSNGSEVGTITPADTVDANGNGTYYINVTPDQMNESTPLSIQISSTDKASNKSETVLLRPDTQLLNEDIRLSVALYYNGELVDLDNIEKTVFDGTYTLKVSAQSSFEFNRFELRMGDTSYVSDAVWSDRFVASEGIHYVDEFEFVLPKNVDLNEAFDDLKVYVENKNPNENAKSKSVSIGILMYDNTDPVVNNSGEAIDGNKWYQDYTLEYEVLSGNGNVESDLNYANYTIAGSKGDAAGDISVSGKTATGAIDIPESASVAGSSVTFAAQDKATNVMTSPGNLFNIKVDKTNPSVAALKVNGAEVTADAVLAGAPVISTTVTDNLTIDNYAIVIRYNSDDEVYSFLPVVLDNKEVTEENVSYQLDKILGNEELKDGTYTINISASDMSRRASNTATTKFIVDNSAPVLGASIMSGTSGKSNGYYNTDVSVRLTCFDNNFDLGAMQVTDNGTAIAADWKVGNDMFYADVTISSEGLHNIKVEGKDKAGNSGEAKDISFVIDKTAPTVSLLTNGGQIYNESRGTLNLTGPLTLTASVSDSNEDAADLRVQVIKTVPDTATTTSEFMPTSERTFTFADEADYVVNIYSVDKANNQGLTRSISFRVDTTAPQITITGVNGGTVANATTVSFNINEAFWSDAKGTVEIYRKAGDGVEETLYKTLNITPTQKSYTLSELLNESGVYRFEFTADDRVGHTATVSQSVTIDRNKPEITLTGVKNFDSTDGAVSISAVINDEFYTNKQVSITGTRTDVNGKKNAITFSPFAVSANPTTINDTFTEDGIYDITISATDIAGNVSSNSVHFTIDTTAPVIGDLSMYDNKTFNAKTFEEIGLDIDLDELVSDLTVCSVRMYLNGSEYDGFSEIEDGSYTLLITAEDELGHVSEKSATFVLDSKEPIFIVTGVEDGEVKNDSYNIEVSLQLDEDTLDEVKLNGSDVVIKNNVATLDVTSEGEYELYMKAYDEAGNEAENTISFVYGNESVATSVTDTIEDVVEKAKNHWWLWAVVAAAVLAAGGGIFFVLKKRGNN